MPLLYRLGFSLQFWCSDNIAIVQMITRELTLDNYREKNILWEVMISKEKANIVFSGTSYIE